MFQIMRSLFRKKRQYRRRMSGGMRLFTVALAVSADGIISRFDTAEHF